MTHTIIKNTVHRLRKTFTKHKHCGTPDCCQMCDDKWLDDVMNNTPNSKQFDDLSYNRGRPRSILIRKTRDYDKWNWFRGIKEYLRNGISNRRK